VRGTPHGSHGLGTDQGVCWPQPERDEAPTRRGQTRLTAHLDDRPSIRFDVGNEFDWLQTIGQYPTPSAKDETESVQARHEVTRLLPQRDQDEIAERVTLDITAPAKSVLKHTRP
jgi:hypothetical protein